MMRRESLHSQIKRRISTPIEKKKKYDGDFTNVISTGSTLLDLAISAGRRRGGGIPGGVLVEVFGPSSSGKTVFLCEIAGNVMRKGGDVIFRDPEARINKVFAKLFDLNINEVDYDTPDTVPEVFRAVRKWQPANISNKIINGAFADSLAALSTKMEMEKEEGDKMGMRRPKELSEELRKTCRLIKRNNYLMVCSNQIRTNVEGYGNKYNPTGGLAIGFYSSLRLQFGNPEKIRLEKTIAGKKKSRVIGIETEITVFKSSIWKPFRTAPVTILFDYGIDDIRQNLQFVKDNKGYTTYKIGDTKLDKEIYKSIRIIEEDNLELKLREEVIDLWEEIESKFQQRRKPKRRL